jgi:ribose 5-phosphate isomerase B
MIAIGSDHGGFALKEIVKKHLEERGLEYVDCGCYSTDSVHYPVYAQAVAKQIQTGACDRGILICSTGIGISMAANKCKGIRAALCHDPYSAKMTRLHNDANVLCMGGLIIGTNLALEITDVFLNTAFSGEERHQKRIDMIEEGQ